MSTLLVVADAEWVVNDVSAAVTDPGTEVRAVDDVDEAAQAVEERHYDAVIIDMQVGSSGGMAITRRLRDSMVMGAAERSPIVILLDRHADAFLARRAGADAHLLKPFTSQALREVLGAITAPDRG
jgi:DNA-binding response OmpR family regulator